MNGRSEVDVAIVGAGLSGLAAADALARAGRTFHVLEAGAAVGGRCRSEPVGSGVANLGAEWIGPRHRRVRALARRLGLRLEPTRFLAAPMTLRTAEGTRSGRLTPLPRAGGVALARAFWRIGRLARRLSVDAPWRASGAVVLDEVSLGAWLSRQGLSGEGYEVMDAFVGDLVSRPIADLSLLHVAWWVRRNGGAVSGFRSAFDARVREGSQELARGLARPHARRIDLRSPALSVEQAGGEVLVRSPAGELRAKRAILAVPATVLGAIGFDPPLDSANRRLAESLAIGPASKVTAHLAAPRGAPRVVVGGRPLTAAWRYGDLVTGFARPPADTLDDETLAGALAGAFGARAGDLRGTRVLRWATEPYAGGCDVCFRPGELTRIGPLLRARHGLLGFAGPERSTWPNNMEGALESGERAAREAVRSLSDKETR